jgi:hypothetical protein
VHRSRTHAPSIAIIISCSDIRESAQADVLLVCRSQPVEQLNDDNGFAARATVRLDCREQIAANP